MPRIIEKTDILLGKSAEAFEHNAHFRRVIAKSIGPYLDASDRKEKTNLVHNITEKLSKRGRFLKKNEEGEWCSVSYCEARNKVAHALRDSSSNKTKVFRKTLKSHLKKKKSVEAKGNKASEATKADRAAETKTSRTRKVTKARKAIRRQEQKTSKKAKGTKKSSCRATFHPAECKSGTVNTQKVDKVQSKQVEELGLILDSIFECFDQDMLDETLGELRQPVRLREDFLKCYSL